ncbi:Hypothetical protein EAG7_04962 [Klebsiella aerogenes]|nr:Hypothetical protein EAG7_04962 [Klebsiella aerogenes]
MEFLFGILDVEYRREFRGAGKTDFLFFSIPSDNQIGDSCQPNNDYYD